MKRLKFKFSRCNKRWLSTSQMAIFEFRESVIMHSLLKNSALHLLHLFHMHIFHRLLLRNSSKNNLQHTWFQRYFWKSAAPLSETKTMSHKKWTIILKCINHLIQAGDLQLSVTEWSNSDYASSHQTWHFYIYSQKRKSSNGLILMVYLSVTAWRPRVYSSG